MNATGRTSSRHSPGRLLLPAVDVEVLTLVAVPVVDPITKLLGHAPPPAEGAAVALLAAPAISLIDAVHKWIRSGSTRTTE